MNPNVKLPLKQVSLSREFAVVLDSQDKTYMWDNGGMTLSQQILESKGKPIQV
jgi:hypothetical protein